MKAYESLDELLDDVDLIDICTTTRGRMDAAVRALAGNVLKYLQPGLAQSYLFLMLLGSVAIVGYLVR